MICPCRALIETIRSLLAFYSDVRKLADVWADDPLASR